MRKNFVEKYRFYKFLEDLTDTPDAAASPVYFFKQVEEIELDVTDFFCYFIRDKKSMTFQACFFVKSKLNRVGSSSFPITQVTLTEADFTKCIFNENICYVKDMLKFLLSDNVTYVQKMNDALNNYEIANHY